MAAQPDEALIIRTVVQRELRKLRQSPDLIVTRLAFSTEAPKVLDRNQLDLFEENQNGTP